MRTTLHGETIAVNDWVYDLVWGTGKVIEVLADGRFRVEFAAGRTYTFSPSGQIRSVQRPTLYWHDPILVVPQRSESQWGKTARVCRAVYTEMRST